MSSELIRICPSCGTENAAQVMRCRCGALLAGVDLVQAERKGAATRAAAAGAAPAAGQILCRFDDCAQPNPPGSLSCLYCNRALPAATAAAVSSGAASAPVPDGNALQTPRQSLLNLPATLQRRYRILRPLAQQGAEAELLLVEALDGGAPLVAKIYRQGIQPKTAIFERLAQVAPEYRVNLLESGHADGYFYELMGYCAHGSWREQMRDGALHEGTLLDFVRSLAPALAAIHAAGLIHRDLKPDNILLTSLNPLQLVLTDFGSASRLDATQRFTGNARTLPYAAPESMSGVIDAKFDYWAFGMIVLECALGTHPFAELSEAVIMHHLSTRSMDLSGVPMPAIRKLLRGLLLRDPQKRWGASEVARWLARDPALAEPVDSGSSHFRQPYHLGREVCDTPEQLAIALARNWKLGVQDSENGQLMAWFRDVQKDQNTVRLLLELKFDMQMQVDLRLLRLILHLAPGIVPMWQGEVLNLRTVLTHAQQALNGDQAAVNWLDVLWRQDVLKLYAAAGVSEKDIGAVRGTVNGGINGAGSGGGNGADNGADHSHNGGPGNADAAALLARWTAAYDDFIAAWDQLLARLSPPKEAGDFANFDDMLYGGPELERPALAGMHARLLAVAHDAAWVTRLRQRLQAQYAEISVDCPWFLELGEVAGMPGAELLVLESLLPQVQQARLRARASRERRHATRQNELESLQREIGNCIGQVKTLARENWLSPAICAQMRQHLDELFEHYDSLRRAGRADVAWQKPDAESQINKQSAWALRKALDRLSEHHSVNDGWFNRYTAAFAILAALVALSRGPRVLLIALLAGVGVAAWRLLPLPGMMRETRTLARSLRSHE